MREDRTVILFVPSDEKTLDIYDRFYKSADVYASKLSSYVSNVVRVLIKYYSLGLSIPSTPNPYSTGGFRSKSNAVELIGVNIQSTGLIQKKQFIEENIDRGVIAAYFHFIRAALYIHSSEAKREEKLIDLVSSHIVFMFLRSLKARIPVTEDTKKVMINIVKYLIMRVYLDIPHGKLIYDIFPPEQRDKFESLKDYRGFQSFVKIFTDFNLIPDKNPVGLLTDFIKTIGGFSYYAITDDFGSLVANCICAMYPVNLYRSSFLNKQLHSEVEQIVYNKFVSKTNVVTCDLIAKYLKGR